MCQKDFRRGVLKAYNERSSRFSPAESTCPNSEQSLSWKLTHSLRVWRTNLSPALCICNAGSERVNFNDINFVRSSDTCFFLWLKISTIVHRKLLTRLVENLDLILKCAIKSRETRFVKDSNNAIVRSTSVRPGLFKRFENSMRSPGKLVGFSSYENMANSLAKRA